jgi:AraC-like DNA-binding protein
LATILLLGAAQAAFLVVLLAGKKGKSLPDGVLAAWLSVLGLHHLFSALFLQGVQLPPALLNVNAGVALLQGPFLFLYVDTLTSGRQRLRPTDALHLLPFVAFSVYVTLVLPRIGFGSSPSVSVFQLTVVITAAILVSVPIYALMALGRLRRHDAYTVDRYSERRGRDLSWLKKIVLALLVVWGVVITVVISAVVAPGLLPAGSRHQMMTAVTLFIYAIGYFGWRQFAVVDPADREDREERGAEEPREEAPRYDRSGLKGSDIESLVERLEAHLDQDRPYLEPGVTLREIAANLDTTPNHLSQAINQGMGKSFHDLINERRVETFKRLALDPANDHRTLLAVAFDSGFSSKSSFNRVFKQIAGVSPRHYVENASAQA